MLIFFSTNTKTTFVGFFVVVLIVLVAGFFVVVVVDFDFAVVFDDFVALVVF